jgi:hypothetical protein
VLYDSKREGINEYGLAWKLKCGQTALAMTIFDDAIDTGNLSIKFESTVEVMRNNATVETDYGNFEAGKVVCTLPLNVLHETTFSTPPFLYRIEIKTGYTSFLPSLYASGSMRSSLDLIYHFHR